MEAEDLIKSQRKQIEELQKQLSDALPDADKLKSTMDSFGVLFTPQIAEMYKVAEQLQSAAKVLKAEFDKQQAEKTK